MTSDVDRPRADTVAATGPYDLTAPTDGVAAAARLIKPRLRGWLHALATPLALVAGLVLVGRAPTIEGRTGGLIFLVSAVLLFGISGLFHRYNWGAFGYGLLRRLDHSNIYIFIAASYTPYALCLLSGASRAWLLSLVWGAAVLGLLFRTFWLNAPRWLYTLMYVVMGCSAAGWLPEFLADTGPGVFALMIGGGILYIIGAVVYGLRWPDPWPRWFGYHEVFHSCTIAAFALHYSAISIVTYSVGS